MAIFIPESASEALLNVSDPRATLLEVKVAEANAEEPIPIFW